MAIDYIAIGRMWPNSKSAQCVLQRESGFSGLIKVEKSAFGISKINFTNPKSLSKSPRESGAFVYCERPY